MRVFLFFLAIVLSGVLPIMISMKQRSFYILTVYPLFALGLPYLLLPWVEALRLSLQGTKWQKRLPVAAIGIAVLGVGLSLSQVNRLGSNSSERS